MNVKRFIVGIVGLTIISLVGCQWMEHEKSQPTMPSGVNASSIANYAQMENGSALVDGQQINWMVSEWGSFPYATWMYLEVNQQDGIGKPPGEGQIPVTLSNVVLQFDNLPNEVTQILIGVKAVHDEHDTTFLERGYFTVINGTVSIPLDYADLIWYFGVTHYSIWFQALGGHNGEGVSAKATLTLNGTMPGGQSLSVRTQTAFGTNPAPVAASADPAPVAASADADGDGVPDASDNCPAVANPQQMATDPNSGCRFIDNNDGGAVANSTVTDSTTGLRWERVADAVTETWTTATGTTGHCATSTLGTYTDWRVPTRAEFQGLVDTTQTNPALPSGHPFTVLGWYWTSENAGAGNAWYVLLINGSVSNATQIVPLNVWCVRG